MVVSAFGEVTWEKTLPVAIQHATASHTPVFIDLYAEWCGPCKMLEKDVFSDPKVQALMKRATCLRLDVDKYPAEAKQFNVTAIPRLLLLSSDGKKVLWDTMGYRDAETFAQEFGGALGVKDVGARPVSSDPPALTKVSAALADGTFHRLKVMDPKGANAGLALLVERLGAYSEKDYVAVADLLKKAGRDALPCLLGGLASKTLAVRVGSYRVIQSILPKNEIAGLKFNPWASTPARTNELANWSRLSVGG